MHCHGFFLIPGARQGPFRRILSRYLDRRQLSDDELFSIIWSHYSELTNSGLTDSTGSPFLGEYRGDAVPDLSRLGF